MTASSETSPGGEALWELTENTLRCRVSNLKYGSVRIDSKTVVFIRANPGKKETTDGSSSHVIFSEVVSPEKWYVTNTKPWA